MCYANATTRELVERLESATNRGKFEKNESPRGKKKPSKVLDQSKILEGSKFHHQDRLDRG